MLLFGNTQLQLLVSQPLVSAAITSLSVPRGPAIPTIVQFVQNGQVYDPETFVTNIASISVANPGVVTTQQPHNIPNGATVAIAGVLGAVPLVCINASLVATVTGASTFTIPVNVTTAATPNTGTVTVVVPVLPRWTVKRQGQYNQDPPSAILNTFAKSGSGTSTTFTGSCNYITDDINQDLGIFTPITQDCTISEANPGVVTTAAQEFNIGGTVVFETTDELAAPLEPGIEYYVTATSLTSTTFTVSATLGGAAIQTTSAGSGTHTIFYTEESQAVASASFMGELSWGGVFPSKCTWVPLTVLNDIYHGDESTPVYTGGCSAKAQIPEGQGYVTIAFPYTLASANWHFTHCYIYNLTDPAPINYAAGVLTAQSDAGFTLQLAGGTPTDSANYYIAYGVALD